MVSCPRVAARRSAPCRAAYPISATAPQLTLWLRAPTRSRQPVMASSHVFAAECDPCPIDPMRPAVDEYTLK
eukprot:4135573-Prymnesium_polylepis.2